jgi:hypothetical protein
LAARNDGCGPGGRGGPPKGIETGRGCLCSPCDASRDVIDSGIAAPTPGIVPSFRVSPGANGPGVIGGSGTWKLPGKRPPRAGFCSP